jgi:hypothetical protein
MTQDQVNAAAATGVTDQQLYAAGATAAQVAAIPSGIRPTPATHVPVLAAHPGFSFDNENRKWKLSMSGWEIGLAIAALTVIILGAFFLGRANGPGQSDLDRLANEIQLAKNEKNLSEAKVASAEALAKLARDQLAKAEAEAQRFQKKWEDCQMGK